MSNSSTEIKIEGMTCSHCKHAVEQAITKVQGVDRVEVDLQLGKAIVHGSIDESALIAAVEDEGYSAQIFPASNHRG
jgi:copper chaperone